MKRVFGKIESQFNVLYLISAMVIGLILLMSSAKDSARLLAGVMALVLVCGDAFHLIPRIIVIKIGNDEKYLKMLGKGKQITSITMTFFYILLWQVGIQIYNPSNICLWTFVIYTLALMRIFLCLLPQNKWTQRYPPVEWGIWRNIPFFLMGLIAAGLFFYHRANQLGFEWAWLAILLSFFFYFPVVLWANKNPKIGMLMLPKTCTYVWLLVMCLSL